MRCKNQKQPNIGEVSLTDVTYSIDALIQPLELIK